MRQDGLDKLASDLATKLGLEGPYAVLAFMQLENPASLILPPGGISLGAITDGLGSFLEDTFGLPDLPDGVVPDALDKVFLTRLEIDLADDIASSTLILGLRIDVDIPLTQIVGVDNDLFDELGLGSAPTLSNPEIVIGRDGYSKNVDVSLACTLTAFDAPFALQATLPGGQFSARYAGDDIKIAKILQSIGVPFPGLELTVTNAAFAADFDQKRFDVSIGLDDINLPKPLGAVHQCQIDVSRTPIYTSGRLSLTAETGGLVFELSAQSNAESLIFEGETASGTEIAVGAAFASLVEAIPSFYAPQIPPEIASLMITRIALRYDNHADHIAVTCEAQFDIDGRLVQISVTRPATGEPSASIMIGSELFALNLGKTEDEKAGSILAATYAPDDPPSLSLRDDLMASVIDDPALLKLVPPISLTPKAAMFARVPVDGNTATIFGLTLDASAQLDLTKLPLLGSIIPPDGANQSGIGNLQVLMSTGALDGDTIGALSDTLGDHYDLPASPDGEGGAPHGLGKGFSFAGEVNFGGATQPLLIGADASAPPDQADDTKPGDKDAKTSPTAPPSVDAKWFSIKKSLGPLYVEKIGLGYHKGELWVFPGASLTIAGLTIGLDGLAVSSPLAEFKPHFHLQGLSVSYANGPVEIGGGFLRADEPTGEAYYGAAVLKTEGFSLSALGSYANIGAPSMFIYIDLDYPIGGPPFFFVTGLTAGFGYNRSLIVPPIEELEEFPFIALARGKRARTPAPGKGETVAAQQTTLADAIGSLQTYIHPEIGQSWLAAGVHFTSFEIVDGFALLALAFGHKFELHVLGSATFSYPPGSNETGHPLSRIDVLVRAAYLPDEGTLDVRAKLADGSFVFDPECHLSGSMAFMSWMKGPHKNDFVLTIGGYHPKFKTPAHYPNAERLAFKWQKSDQLTLKGSIYFAMTGSYLMAGGALEGTWESGALSAGLKISADFLIRYKPFHYDASMSIDLHATVTIHFFGSHHFSVSLGAHLHLWGPPFSGTVSFDIWIASFSISFGDGTDDPEPLDWSEFKKSFLPPSPNLVTLKPAAGLVRELKKVRLDDDLNPTDTDSDGDKHWVVNAKEFTLHLNTFIPINDVGNTHNVGIAPMDIRDTELRSRKSIFVRRHGEDMAQTTAMFDLKPQTAKQPAGLWGNTFKTEPSGNTTVDNALADFHVCPAHPIAVGSRKKIARSALAFATENLPIKTQWIEEQPLASSDWPSFGARWGSVDPAKLDAGATDTALREQILKALLSPEEISRITGGPSAEDYHLKHPKRV